MRNIGYRQTGKAAIHAMMAYTDYFKNITQRRLVLSVLAGGVSALILEAVLIFFGIEEHMPFILLGIFAILLLALLDWLDFCFVVFGKTQ